MSEAAAAKTPLRVVSVNDVYVLERLPRLASLIRAAREGADKLLVVLAGDFLSPSLLSSIDGGFGMVDCLNAIGLTHYVLGNHEADLEVSVLRRRIGELDAVFLASNTPELHPRARAFDVIEVEVDGGTQRVGLVGVVTREPSLYRVPPFDGTLVDAEPNAVVLQSAEALATGGCSLMIPVTHQIVTDDRLLAATPMPLAVPVVLGGHEHQRIVETIEVAAKPAETRQLVKVAPDASEAAILDFAWHGSGEVSCTLRIEQVADYAEDEAVRARVERHMKSVRELERATLHVLTPGEVLSSVGTRLQQTSLGGLLCTRARDALGADIALINGGGIRGARDYRERFTFADLKQEMPFDNEMVVVQLPGQVLADAIVQSRSRRAVLSGGFFQHDDGASCDPDDRLTMVAGRPWDPARVYQVALVRNFLAGLDRIDALTAFAAAHPERIPPEFSGREIKMIVLEGFARTILDALASQPSLDRDGDGRVSAEELWQAMRRVRGPSESPMMGQLVMQALDHDQDGFITVRPPSTKG
jgi:2',3'-cyclic-nucleotide 2'-phosphodiesterase (5'-nucleotidase family)